MIEIGSRSSSSTFARRLASVLGTACFVLILVWLARGWLDVSQYSYSLLLLILSLIVVGMSFRTRTNRGVSRAASSLLGRLAWASVACIVVVILLGWIAGLQGTGFPSRLTSLVPTLVIAALGLGLVSFGVSKLARDDRKFRAENHPLIVPSGSTLQLGPVKITSASDAVVIPVSKFGSPYEQVLFGQLRFQFETPMGALGSTMNGPAVLRDVPLVARKGSEDDVKRITGKRAKELLADAESESVTISGGSMSAVDLPFVKTWHDNDTELVQVGPLNIKVDHGDDVHINIGGDDFHIDRSPTGNWSVTAQRDSSFVTSKSGVLTAKWNSTTLQLRRDAMKMSSGGDGFEYDPTQIKTHSPMHTLHVTQQGISLNTEKFTVKITGPKVVLRTNGKTSSTDSQALADDLRAVLADLAKKQVQDVMDGLPIDLSEMLSKTEEVLTKHE